MKLNIEKNFKLQQTKLSVSRLARIPNVHELEMYIRIQGNDKWGLIVVSTGDFGPQYGEVYAKEHNHQVVYFLPCSWVPDSIAVDVDSSRDFP